ncbi:MAG TPA: hypothetical protein VKG65_04170 [Terriglobales bacterium]|nr:hypothetical protein [Terriglobales bacterium]
MKDTKSCAAMAGIVLGTGAVLLFVIALAVGPLPAQELPPQSHPYGETYSEWAASWWQWGRAVPLYDSSGKSINPLADNFADCSIDQSGHVWFLANGPGAFVVDQNGNPIAKTCTVPPGRAILVNVISNAYIAYATDRTLDDVMAPHTPTVVQQCTTYGVQSPQCVTAAEEASFDAGNITSVTMTVDGAPIPNFQSQFLTESPVFQLTASDIPQLSLWLENPSPSGGPNNLEGSGYSALPYTSVAKGWFVMLHPLSKGKHELHWEVYRNGTTPFRIRTYDITISH